MLRMLLFWAEPRIELIRLLQAIRIVLLARLRITLIGSGRRGEVPGSIEAFDAMSQAVSQLREGRVGILDGLPEPHCLVEHPEALKYGSQLSKKLILLHAPVHLGLAAFCSHLTHRQPIVASRRQALLQIFSARLEPLIFVLSFFTGPCFDRLFASHPIAGTLCVITDD
jgi:hypothetical protein